MSRGFQGRPAENPNNCTDPYTPSFWLGKPGALTQIRMPDAGIRRDGADNFAVRNLLDGQSVDRSPYLCRTWTFTHQWLTPDVMSVFMEYATRQRGIGPFILIDPQMKNLLSPNQASGTDALHTTEGFAVTGTGDVLSSSTAWFQQGERSLLWQQIVPTVPAATQVYDIFARNEFGTWGISTSGHTWTTTGGVGGDYGTNPTDEIGYQQSNSANVMRTQSIPTDKNAIFAADFYFTSSVATGAPWRAYVQGRYTDQSNFYAVEFTLSTAGVFTYQLVKFVAGVRTTLSSLITSPTTYVSRTPWRAEIYTVGTTINARVYPVVAPAPDEWTFEVTDSSLTTGGNGALSTKLDVGGTGAPYINFDNVIGNFAKGGVLTVSTPTGLYGFCLPPGATYAFSGYVRGYPGSDASVDATPRVALMNGVGAVGSTVNGTVISTVTGSATSFCVTGVVPPVTGAVYVSPQIVISDASVTDQAGLYLDQLQFELTPTGACTTWEYGQGQPFVGVRAENESVPRILRTDVNYIAVEVT
jgi:hypothetical protein